MIIPTSFDSNFLLISLHLYYYLLGMVLVDLFVSGYSFIGPKHFRDNDHSIFNHQL